MSVTGAGKVHGLPLLGSDRRAGLAETAGRYDLNREALGARLGRPSLRRIAPRRSRWELWRRHRTEPMAGSPFEPREGQRIDRTPRRRPTFRVGRMDCSAEEQLVRMRLDSLDAVEGVAVDLEERTVTVTHRGGVSQLERALDSLRLDTTVIGTAEGGVPPSPGRSTGERRALGLALAINATLFVGEFGAGILANSMGLVADSLDMLADASVYSLSLFAVGRGASRKRSLAAASGYLQLGLAVAGLVEVSRRFLMSEPLPDPRTMIGVAAVALLGNVATLVLLRRARSAEVHFQASWIFTSNDIKVNGLVIASAVAVALTESAVPDLVAGALVFLVVGNGARRILRLSRQDVAEPTT